MDVAKAGDQIDALIERRARERSSADELEEMYRASVRRHRERKRKAIRAEWFCYFSNLADSLRASAEHYDRKAEALLEDEPKGAR